jgi:hypothetical protein
MMTYSAITRRFIKTSEQKNLVHKFGTTVIGCLLHSLITTVVLKLCISCVTTLGFVKFPAKLVKFIANITLK